MKEKDPGPMRSIANFLFEVGMLKRIQRTGWAFFGDGGESVAEHAMRTAVIGYALAKLRPEVDEARLIKMCLLHDLPETRIGDLNYVHKRYVRADEERAVSDLARTVPFGSDYEGLIEEFNKAESEEARMANDADQLDLILQLKEHGDLGSPYHTEWLDYALKRLHTDVARSLAEEITRTDWTEWWFHDKGDWWVRGGRE